MGQLAQRVPGHPELPEVRPRTTRHTAPVAIPGGASVAGHLGELLVLFDVLVELDVVLFDGVGLLVEKVDIVVQTVVLILSLNKSRNNLLNI